MSSNGSDRPKRASYGALAGILLALLVIRWPLLQRQPGGQDEEWYAVPGYTVATEGIPRIPYAPARDRGSVFYKADHVLTTLPPAYFYWQAPWFWLLPARYGTARIPSALAGLLTIWMVYEFGRRVGCEERAALGAAALYSLARVFYFPATTARPDMLCGMWGIAALWCTWEWSRSFARRRLILAGVLCGLGLLTHPFAIVYCLQIGVWVLWASRGWKQSIRDGALLTAIALAVWSAWLPLILADTEAFREQFVNNVFEGSGPGLMARLLWPWPSFVYQAGLFWSHVGPWQTVLMLVGVAAVILEAARRRTPAAIELSVLTCSAIYLMVACVGLHPATAYWCYPGALAMICTARLVAFLATSVSRRHDVLAPVVCGAALLLMLPGLGLRAWVVHLQHWNDADYDTRRFVPLVIAGIRPEERLLVDPGYVFDAWVLHPHVVLASDAGRYFQADDLRFDWLIVGRYGLKYDLPRSFQTRLVAEFGNRDDLFACYAQLHVPRDKPAQVSAAAGTNRVADAPRHPRP